MASTLHATCVSYKGCGVLLIGASGAGKSSIGLQLMALGCDLISDDQTCLTPVDGRLIATCPPTLKGLIEARGVGILNANHALKASVSLVVDLDQTEITRLPPAREITLAGCTLPLIWRCEGPQFVPAILQILKSSRSH